MAVPSQAITRFDLSLTYQEFSTLAQRRKFVGLDVYRPVGVQQEAAEFARINIDSLLGPIENTKRAPRSTYARDYWKWHKDNYAVEEHGVEETVDDAEIEMYGDIIRVEQISAERAVNRVLMPLEQAIADAAQDTGTLPNGAVGTTWTNKSGCDPIADIDKARNAVEDATGESMGVTVVIPKPAFINMIRSDRLEALMKYDAYDVLAASASGFNLNAVPDIQSGLLQVLQVDRILVARASKRTDVPNESGNATLGRYWNPDRVTVCLTSSDGMTGDLASVQPCLGRTIFTSKNSYPVPGDGTDGTGSLVMEEYREEARRGGVLRPRNKYQVKTLHTEAAYVLTGANS